MRTPRFRLGVAAVAIAIGGVLAAVGPASTAVAFFSSPLFLDVRVDAPGTLIAKGVAVSVPVEVTCAAAQSAWVDVSVSERVARQIAGGNGSAPVWCNGHRQVIQVTVYGQIGSKAFVKGKALVTAVISGCTRAFCGDETDSRTIALRR